MVSPTQEAGTVKDNVPRSELRATVEMARIFKAQCHCTVAVIYSVYNED